ncbi:class I SAM-dependent DNA methyltransferase [Liquorilactobacillus mali]|uniref:SAM-dependent methyltransferase n=1 Tax=Liquorilactobacillus mali KCTC 3596 = DSM 20444 TaxID=1046596 RepID=A0A0R2E292_9LACO|nr:class I SAM-dependent methyltransferase [Liquorilactobacillus mali]KRN10512.1 SAM-dependent methyltransferase [Liquorilactobacillus mali KCTC 3596 = DSM 20444]MDC7951878.1 class I SAM-dependent methyltransferase [Liquorilactobacillus mali]MDV7757093.1 methyltransferase domain-containing protein [Liquorilactobacillus mali]QFQ75070.1 class I SAM-dependent methyltransferase [Liquorilactobacillus mali]
MIYSTFAQIYDELMDPEIYDNWAKLVDTVTDKQHKKLLDLACGAGRLAVILAKDEYQVTGVDLSEEMLSLAEVRAREEQVKLELLSANMTDLSELENFDIVTCGLDSLCYLADKDELLQTFQEVAGHLNGDGVFIFDVISPHQTDVVYPGYMYNYTTQEQAFLWESFAGEVPHSVIHDLTFFVANKDRTSYQRYEETHYERTYDLNVYLELLAKAGFNKVKATADYGNGEIDEETTRFFFVCHKA